jgi:hypothetical protein
MEGIMARGLIRFYGSGVVTRKMGPNRGQTILRFVNGEADVDMGSVLPNEAARLMQRFVYQTLDAEGNPTGAKMRNGCPVSDEEIARPRVIINEEPREENDTVSGMKRREAAERLRKEQEAPAPDTAPDAHAPDAPVDMADDTVKVADVKAANTRKDLVQMARKIGCDFSKSDNTDNIRAKIIKHLEG